MKLVPWLNFDKQNELTAKLLCDELLHDYSTISGDYDVIMHCLEPLVYNFMGFVVLTFPLPLVYPILRINDYKILEQRHNKY